MKRVADQFVETLAAAGVKRIYGIVGDSLNGLTDAIRRQGKIEWVHVRHEEVAAFAAGAEAHLTGRARGLRGELRAGQSASDQRSVRLPPLARPRARHRRAHPLGRDRQRLFSGDPSADTVPGMQPLLRTRLERQPDAARARGRDPRGGRQARRVGGGDSRRRRAAAGLGRPAGQVGGPAAAAAGRDAVTTRISIGLRHCSTATAA